jgi:hypothetical protein
MSELIVVPGGWPHLPTDVEELYGPTTDTEYEENLRACRVKGHDLHGGWSDEGEFMVCQRCKVRFVEDTA